MRTPSPKEESIASGIPAVLVIDNYDSYAYNLVQLIGSLGAQVRVVRNDAITVDEVEALSPCAVVLSPGPKRPEDAGVSLGLIRSLGARIPMIGVCLGHQSIGLAFGAQVRRAAQVRHGRTSEIHHDGTGVYRGLPDPFVGARYHSLIIDRETLPPCFRAVAWTDDGVLMGIRHRDYALEGVQFHPESFLTPLGSTIIRRFLDDNAPGWRS